MQFIPQELSKETGEELKFNSFLSNLPPEIVIPTSSYLIQRRRTNTELFIEFGLQGEDWK